MPPPGTAVTLVITIPSAKELAEAKKNEVEDDKETRRRNKAAEPGDGDRK